MTTIDEATKHVAKMQDPRSWPRWPWLPLKRSVAGQSWPELGLMFADDTDGGRVRVFDAHLAEATMARAVALALDRESGLTVGETFDSPEDAVAAGWRVD